MMLKIKNFLLNFAGLVLFCLCCTVSFVFAKSYPFEIFAFFLIFCAYYIFCFVQVPADKRALVLTFQNPSKILNPGLRFVFRFLQDVILFDTKTMDLEFGDFDVTTKDLTAKVKGVSLRVKWDDLLLAIAELGGVEPEKQLHNILREVVVEAVRQTLIVKEWREVVGSLNLNSEILQKIIASDSITISNVGTAGTVKILEIHWETFEVPEEFQKSIRAKQSAQLKREAQIIEREGEGEARLREAKWILGLAVDADVPADKQESVQQTIMFLRQLERDEKMAQGEGDMILFPSQWGNLDPRAMQALLGNRLTGNGTTKPKKP